MNFMDIGNERDKVIKFLKYIIDTEGSCSFNQCVMCAFFNDINNDGRKVCELSPLDGNDFTRKQNAINVLGKINK